MSTILKEELNKRIFETPFFCRKGLVITPILDDQIGDSSVDVRLGNEFLIIQKRSFSTLDLSSIDDDSKINQYYSKIRLDNYSDIILHPGQLILGATLEFIRLPYDCNCYVIGKSTWGRMGLVIATATNVDPGFRGCITLEMINQGEVPIKLRPGVAIAQLVLHKSKEEVVKSYSGSYTSTTGPEIPKFAKKRKQWEFWFKQKKEYFCMDDDGNNIK